MNSGIGVRAGPDREERRCHPNVKSQLGMRADMRLWGLTSVCVFAAFVSIRRVA